ncbi:MAG: ribbon-helix-helix domain-containing protein [Gemmatimonadales bacterium]
MSARKMTFSLDPETAERIDRMAERLKLPKSGVVREAVREYAAHSGRLKEAERVRLLGIFDELVPRIPGRPVEEVERELEEIRTARRRGGRATPERPG